MPRLDIPRFVMLHGMPGVGKSTLAELLAAALATRGVASDLVPEEAIFTRDEFAEVGRGFRTEAWPTAEMVLAAYDRVLGAARQHGRWVIADWNCVGMIEDLPWAQPDGVAVTTTQPAAHADMSVLVAHARNVRVLARDVRPILFVLNAPSRLAVMRAAAQRGTSWVERYATFVGEPLANEPPLDRIVRWYAQILPRHNDIVDAYHAAGWNVATIDATSTDQDVLGAALTILGDDS